MNCNFLSGEVSNIPSASFALLQQPKVKGSESRYYTLEEGYACLQTWEIGYYQVCYCCAYLEMAAAMEIRHTGNCETLIINLSGNLELTEYSVGRHLLNNLYGIILIQENIHGYCTLRGIHDKSRVLLITYKIEELVLPTANYLPFVIPENILGQIEKLLNASSHNEVDFAIDIVKDLFSDLKLAASHFQQKPFLSALELASIGDLKIWLDAHIEVDHSPEKLALKAGMDIKKMSKGFYQLYGKHPFDYIREERLLMAHVKVVSTHMQLKVIGKWAGYHSYPNFSAAFKSYFGYSPRSLRKL